MGKQFPSLANRRSNRAPSLKVSSDIVANHPRLLPDTNLGDYLRDDVEFGMLEAVEIFIYEYGKPLIKPDHPPLRTMMRRLHEWYMDTCRKSGKDSILLRIKDEHGLIGVELLPIEFVELFQLYNEDALDKQLMSCYFL